MVALPLKIFGCEFSTYVLINHVMFLVPAVLVQALTDAKNETSASKMLWLNLERNEGGKMGALVFLIGYYGI